MKSLYWRMVFFLKTRKSRKMRKSLGTNIRAIITQSSNGLFAVDPEDLEVGEKLRKGGFGLDEIERIKSLISDDSRVLIVGSHIGSLVIPISRHCKEIVAIEANPKTYELLSLNLRLNNIENVVSHNIAASEKTEIITFFLNTVNSGGSKRAPKQSHFMYEYDSPERVEIQAHALDTHLSNHAFDLVLMDIEGSEFFALKGMPKILQECKSLIVEFLPHHLRNVAGVDAETFLKQIPERFTKVTIPSQNVTLSREEAQAFLLKMFRDQKGDDGLIFQIE
ncbi:MAG TPA: FkbM family methyltransferase [Candidatus Poseidoniales archaeon]|nr:MAG TPA: FkbM family methyltransferase [Candidatus Poseidoniales archaeon]HII62679.1 FkbM family methyltransferase [Candidatus Poseidoniaceae archaeon]